MRDNQLHVKVLCLKLISNYCVYISALLLLYDVTNKASFDNIRVSMLCRIYHLCLGKNGKSMGRGDGVI